MEEKEILEDDTMSDAALRGIVDEEGD